MPLLLGIQIENYRALRDVRLGQLSSGDGEPMPRLVCCIGPNGCGKSTLLDVFGFLADCLREGVEAACDKPHRGGFERLRTQGATGPIGLRLFYRQGAKSRPIAYGLKIDAVKGRPIVVEETLHQARKGAKRGRLFPFLVLKNGEGTAWSGEATEGEEATTRVDVALDDATRLGITTLGQLREHPRITGLRAYIEGWYLSYFVPDAARVLPPTGAQRHLDRTGSNLANYLLHLSRNHPQRLARALEAVSGKIPGMRTISTRQSLDRRLLIEFNEQGYQDAFYQMDMSDGTLKLFAYLLLLQDPEPHPFIGVEEPENGLYHRLIRDLAEELVAHAHSKSETQVFVTTHSPVFVDALAPEQVWLLQKESDGGVSATRTADIPTVSGLHAEGLPLGSLWFSRHLQERGFGDG